MRPIVVCDGDEDAFRVASWWRDGSVTALLLGEQSGPYVAMNTGLAESTAEWITFCGADDEYADGRIKQLLNLSRVYGWTSVLNTWHEKIDRKGRHIKGGTEALGGVFMYHRNMMERLGGFEAWPCSADTDLYRRAIDAGGHRAIVKRPLYRYRQHGNQITHRGATSFGSKVRNAYESIMAIKRPTHVEPKCADIVERIRQ